MSQVESKNNMREEASDAASVAYKLGDALRSTTSMESPDVLIAVAYVLLLAKREKAMDVENLATFLEKHCNDRMVCDYLHGMLQSNWEVIRRLVTVFSEKELKSFIISDQINRYFGKTRACRITGTPIVRLALAILDLKDNESIGDLCCGDGAFMTEIIRNPQWQGVHFTGKDISHDAICISKIRADVLGGDINLEQKDMLEKDSDTPREFDKVFIDPPYGVRGSNFKFLTAKVNGEISRVRALVQTASADFIPPTFPLVKSVMAAEWFWGLKGLSVLKKDGKVVLITCGNALFNQIDSPVRKYLIDRGLIEEIIAMPPRLSPSTGIKLYMLVLSENNKVVKMVDASESFVQGAHGNDFSDENIAAIVNAHEDGSSCRIVTPDILAEADYNLCPERHLNLSKVEISGSPLAELIKSVQRGIPFTASDLKEAAPDILPDVLFLNMSNIQDGLIDKELPHLPGRVKGWQSACATEGDLVISRTVSPLKLAVVEGTEGRRLACSANLFIVKLDTNKCDPYYVKAFLESKAGIAQLNRYSTGTVVSVIKLETFRKILIPLLPMEKQREFAEEYRAKIGRIRLLRTQLDMALQTAGSAFDDYSVKES